jgi:hypothetical protein
MSRLRPPTRLILALIFLVSLGGPLSAQQRQYRYWTTQWSFEDIDVGVLVNRLKLIGLELPVALSGRATVQFDVSVPLNALRTGRAYKLDGKLTATDFRVDQLQLESFQADVDFRDGELTLSEVRVDQASGGALNGEALAQMLPRGDFRASLSADAFRLEPVIGLLSKLKVLASPAVQGGVVTGQLEASGQVNEVGDPLAWEARGEVAVSGMTTERALPLNADLDGLQLANRRLEIAELHVTSPALPQFLVRGDGSVDLGQPVSFSLDVTSNDLPADDLVRLFADPAQPWIEGKLDLAGTAQGSLPAEEQAPEIRVDLAVASPALRLFGVHLGTIEHDLRVTPERFRLTPRAETGSETVSNLTVRSVSADYRWAEQAFEVEQLRASIFDGELSGGGSLARSDTGRHQLEATWNDIAPEVTVRLPAASRPAPIVATTSGTIDWTVPADQLAQPFAHRGRIEAQIEDLRVSGQRIGEAQVDVAISEAGLQAEGSASAFGGDVAFRTRSPANPQTSWRELPWRVISGRWAFTDLALGEMLRLGGQRGRLDGTLAGKAEVGIESGWPSLRAAAELRLESLSADGVLVARQLQAVLRADRRGLELESLRGTYAGGQLQAQGTWAPQSGQRMVRFRLTGADGNRLLLPISPAAASWLGGNVSGRGTLAGAGEGIFDEIRVQGRASVDNGTTFDMPFGDAHSPFLVQWQNRSSRWMVDFPVVQSSLAGGRVRGSLAFDGAAARGSGFDLDSQWRLGHVDFESLLAAYVGTPTVGQGDLTGRLRIEGDRIRTARDLKGRFDVRLGGTDATAVPGLSATGALLGATSLAGTRFTEGVALGRIDRGALQLKTVTLVSDRMGVQGGGRVGLLDQRLDIQAILSTGNFQGQDAVLNLVGLQDLVTAVPLGQINRLLSDRTIVFQLVGTTRDPIVRLLTAETVRANARRFAVQEALGVIAADSLLWD